jgi:hypothetical protein
VKTILNKILQSLSLVIIICLVGYIIFLQQCSGIRIRRDQVIVEQSFLDSLNAAAKKPPEVKWRDSIIYKDTTIYRDHFVPQPYLVEKDTSYYSDKLEKGDIWVSHWLKVHGEILDAEWSWKLPPKYLTIKEIYINRPVPVERKVPVNKRALYGSFSLGGDPNTWQGSAAAYLDYTDLKGNIYGASYTRFNKNNIYQFKFGKRIFPRK